MYKVPTNHDRFVLLDANLVAGYYLPESLSSVRTRPYIQNLMDSVRNEGSPEVLLYIPELCIPEVFAVFAKYRFATWDRSVQKNLSKKFKKSDYDTVLASFQNDIRNNCFLNRVELNNYHILATHLISRVDANFEYYRKRKTQKATRQKKMMGAVDHSIIGIGINLTKIHGRENFVICTADHRFADILTRATSVKPITAKKLGLPEIAKDLGLEYSKYIYPRVINLAKTTKTELQDFFRVWPLPTDPMTRKQLVKLTSEDCKLLVELREKSGVGRDSLPYTYAFESICRKFESIRGHAVNRNAAWMAIGRIEKKGKRKKRQESGIKKQKAFF